MKMINRVYIISPLLLGIISSVIILNIASPYEGLNIVLAAAIGLPFSIIAIFKALKYRKSKDNEERHLSKCFLLLSCFTFSLQAFILIKMIN